MAGVIPASIDIMRDGSWDVTVDACPAAGDHLAPHQRCETMMFDGEVRRCPYLLATTDVSNSTHRRQAAFIVEDMKGRSSSRYRCGVLCLRSKANRPPGC